MNTPSSAISRGSRLLVSSLVLASIAACTVSDTGREDRSLMTEQRRRLDALGIAAVQGEDAMTLFDATGEPVGTLSHAGPTVSIELGPIAARLQRGGPGLQVQCSTMPHDVVLSDPGTLARWIADDAVDVACARAVAIAAVITEIDRAHAPGCVTTQVDGGTRLDCSGADELADDESFRLMSSGRDCGCVEDWSGYCPAECWSCGQLCDPWGTGDPWGGWGGGGGSVDPDPPPPPPPCTSYGNDCTAAQACCGSNVCAFGGERDEPWCQPLETAQWQGSCVQARAGSTVYKNGNYCRTINGEETASTCHEVSNQRCVIGYNGDCGSGDYSIRIRDLAQVSSDNCP